MEHFDKLHDSVRRRRDISPAAKIVYAFMRRLIVKKRPVGQRLIARECGLSKSTVGEAQKQLVEAGLLFREPPRAGKRGRFLLPSTGPDSGRSDDPVTTGENMPTGPDSGHQEAASGGAGCTGPDSGHPDTPRTTSETASTGLKTGHPPAGNQTGLKTGHQVDQIPATSGLISGHDQSPELTRSPSLSPARPVTNFGLLPDPLAKPGDEATRQVSVEEFTLRLWQRAGQNRGAPAGPIAPRERQALDDVTAWARQVAPDVGEARGLTLTEAFKAAVVHSLRAFAKEFDGRREWADANGATLPAWRATWWHSNLTTYAMGLTAAA